MKKITIKVPRDVEYLSDFIYKGKPYELPNGILNKELTGCGGTTLALESGDKTIICSPRIKLLENKWEQYTGCLLVIGSVNISEIRDYISSKFVPKILVTYDSFKRVKDCIDDLSDWKIVVDEFQCLLSDSSFKADTELFFLNDLKECPYVTYLSATPILDKYLNYISFFSDKTYYQLDWEDKRKVNIERIKTNNPISAITSIINDYKNGNYKTRTGIASKEMVIYINSVSNIMSLIRSCDLQAEDVNILVANTLDNKKIIKKLGSKYSMGRIPLRGESHKKFTFCTSTAYMGVDFYSTNASSYVISDCTNTNTSIDISTELCQIAGRQRLRENVFRDTIFFIYNTNIAERAVDDFDEYIANKKRLTMQDLQVYNSQDEEYRKKKGAQLLRSASLGMYEEFYTTYNKETNTFVINELAVINELWQYDVQMTTYKDGISIKRELDSVTTLVSDKAQQWLYCQSIKDDLTKTSFVDKMSSYCEYRDSGKEELCSNLASKNINLVLYYDALGVDKIKALGYQENRIKEEYKWVCLIPRITHQVHMSFKSGEKYPMKDIKDRLQNLYDVLEIKKTAKATDLEEYGYELIKGLMTIKDKRVNCYQLKKL